MYKNLIFDLDGTITNNYKGIFNSLKHSLEMLNYENIPTVLPQNFIGPPLQKSFRDVFELNSRNTELAVGYFREYYGKAGLYENEVYDGIHELFENLADFGYCLYVATSKLQKYANLILRHFELDRYISDIAGAQYNGNHTKALLIERLLVQYNMRAKETIMIGDTYYDIIGAKECTIDSIAVGYGFGSKQTLLDHNPTYYAETTGDLAELFLEIL